MRTVEEMVKKKLTPPAWRIDSGGCDSAVRASLSSNFCLSLGFIPSHCSPSVYELLYLRPVSLALA